MEDGATIATSQCHLFQERQQTRKKGSKVVLKKEQELNSIQFLFIKELKIWI